jgi:hypothetical protein
MDVLDTERGAVLAINVTGGRVNIYVVSDLEFAERAKVRIIGTGASTSLVSFVTLQESKIDIGRNASIQGSLIAPHAEVHFAAACKFKGAISAETITLNQNVLFSFHSAGVLAKEGDEEYEDGNEEELSSEALAVTSYQLEQNYPNPFNPETMIAFALPEAGEVSLAIFNSAGQLVRRLVKSEMAAGWHNVVWDAKDEHGVRVASGVYVYVMKAGSYVEQRKLVLMK